MPTGVRSSMGTNASTAVAVAPLCKAQQSQKQTDSPRRKEVLLAVDAITFTATEATSTHMIHDMRALRKHAALLSHHKIKAPSSRL